MNINILITSATNVLHSILFYGENISSEFFRSFPLSERYNEHQFQVNGFMAIAAGYFIL
ncbi:hypothetical protein AB4Y90_16510 [Chryseobacterium sp. 2TAF14]|uniref:hypothetical protein n=1 Tax=Chryseobacterium sp. 2TAF14 TaxID=3233007 RepID=UPI003F928037